jgi:hypothetical protein
MESTVQSRGKRLVFFIVMDEVRRTGGFHVVATCPQPLRRGRLGILLTRK